MPVARAETGDWSGDRSGRETAVLWGLLRSVETNYCNRAPFESLRPPTVLRTPPPLSASLSAASAPVSPRWLALSRDFNGLYLFRLLDFMWQCCKKLLILFKSIGVRTRDQPIHPGPDKPYQLVSCNQNLYTTARELIGSAGRGGKKVKVIADPPVLKIRRD